MLDMFHYLLGTASSYCAGLGGEICMVGKHTRTLLQTKLALHVCRTVIRHAMERAEQEAVEPSKMHEKML